MENKKIIKLTEGKSIKCIGYLIETRENKYLGRMEAVIATPRDSVYKGKPCCSLLDRFVKFEISEPGDENYSQFQKELKKYWYKNIPNIFKSLRFLYGKNKD